MLLAINCGNTNVVFAVYDGPKQRGVWRAATEPRRTADEYLVWLKELMGLDGIRPTDIDGAIISIVVPDALFALKTLCRRYFACDPLVIGEDGCNLGIGAKVDHAAEVGADRLVNSVAAHSRYGGPLIVVDFGTATTFDVVDEDGNYCGGVIAPGIQLSLQALYLGTAKLPKVAIKRPEKVIGTNTTACIQSGVYWGYVGLIEGTIDRIRAEFGKPMKVVATGGLAPLFNDATDAIEQAEPDLTLRGLCEIYGLNRGTNRAP
jgi:type III pantothenate kinase